MNAPLRALSDLAHAVRRLLGGAGSAAEPDPEAARLVREAEQARRAGDLDEARRLYRRALEVDRHHVDALRALRDLAIEAGAWAEALSFAERLPALAAAADRPADAARLAGVLYEMGRAELVAGRTAPAIGRFRAALKADREFVPAAVALGDALEAAGDHREALRTWERAAESHPSTPLLARLERAWRQDGRPGRMIAAYRDAVERAPDDLSLALALGRVYFELEMLDEAADQVEKIEVRAPDVAVVHAFLGAIFERRGQIREACEEYRRALRLNHGFEWPHRCSACGASFPGWRDRCPQCGRWSTARPVGGA